MKTELKYIMKKISDLLVGGDDLRQTTQKNVNKNLIRLENEIGRQIFGEPPVGGDRDFFCLDDKTWAWYEKNSDGKVTVTRYEIFPDYILKIHNNGVCKRIEAAELKILSSAIWLYYEQVMKRIYQIDPFTGRSQRSKIG